MSNAIVANVYRYVIDDVINQVRSEFEDMGIDESILQELQRSWEAKVARSRVANFAFSDENYYDEDEEGHATMGGEGLPALPYPNNYTQGAAASLVSLASTGVAMRHHIKTENDAGPLRQPGMPQDAYPLPQRPGDSGMEVKPINHGTNGQFHMMHPQAVPQHQQQQRPQGSAPSAHEMHLPGGGRPNIPQTDGGNDIEYTTSEIDAYIAETIMRNRRLCQEAEDDNEPTLSFTSASAAGQTIPFEHLPKHLQKLMKRAMKRAGSNAGSGSGNTISQVDGNGDTDENEINSDLDDSDDADDDVEGGEEIEHIILCLYDKVTRTKNKWKCVLKDGIMLVNGRDYLFQRATGDFEW